MLSLNRICYLFFSVLWAVLQFFCWIFEKISSIHRLCLLGHYDWHKRSVWLDNESKTGWSSKYILLWWIWRWSKSMCRGLLENRWLLVVDIVLNNVSFHEEYQSLVVKTYNFTTAIPQAARLLANAMVEAAFPKQQCNKVGWSVDNLKIVLVRLFAFGGLCSFVRYLWMSWDKIWLKLRQIAEIRKIFGHEISAIFTVHGMTRWIEERGRLPLFSLSVV